MTRTWQQLSPWWIWLCAFLLGTIAAGATACVDGENPRSEPTVDCGVGKPVVDPALLAFLSKAKAAHHQADLAQEDGDAESAIKFLAQLVDGPVPGGESPSPEAREVLADTLARMAEIESGRQRFDDGIKLVERGLELAVERTHYRGRLMEVRGVVEQRRHDKLLEDGDEDAAKAAKERAIAAFQEAIAIQDEVIQNSLGDLLDEPAPKP